MLYILNNSYLFSIPLNSVQDIFPASVTILCGKDRTQTRRRQNLKRFGPEVAEVAKPSVAAYLASMCSIYLPSLAQSYVSLSGIVKENTLRAQNLLQQWGMD